MRPYLVFLQTVVAVVTVVVCSSAAGTQATEDSCTVFPDAKFVTPGAGVDLDIEDNDCSAWGCEYDGRTFEPTFDFDGSATGRGCGEKCVRPTSVPQCRKNEYTAHCDPPHNARCVACPQVGAEAAKGGYSFAQPGVNSKEHDQLHQRGTFEFAKLYPAVLPVRSAVDQRNSTIGMVQWRDIMFASSTAIEKLQWYGLGKIDLEHTIYYQGAHQSDVYMKLSAPTAKIRVCNVEFSNGDPWGTGAVIQKNSNTRGLIYEFWYRQVLEYTQDISAIVYLTLGTTEHRVLRTNNHPALASTNQWTLVQGVFDHVSAHESVPALGCLQLDFKMKEGHEVLVDDLRLLRSLFSNSFFDVWDTEKENRYGKNGGWTEHPSNNKLVTHYKGPPYSYVHIPKNRFINQVVQLPTQLDVNGVYVAATLSIYARLGGTASPDAWLLVESRLDEMNEGFWVLNTPELVIKTQLTKSAAWTLVSVPLTLRVNNMGGQTTQTQPRYSFTLRAYKGAVEVKSALLYVDDRRCPIHGCDNPRTEVLVNGQCERCSTTRSKCDATKYQTGCELVGFFVDATCSLCTLPDNSEDGSWSETSALECSYVCAQGYWFKRGTGGGAGSGNDAAVASKGTCAQCTPLASLQCPIGFYARACGVDFDAACVPCNDLDVSDHTVVYTAGAHGEQKNLEDKDSQCTHACAPGSFQYGVVDGTSTPTCFPCTTSVCGAADNGISTLRLIDGLQYTSECMPAKDSRCQLCRSDDPNVIFTGSADTVGAWCDHECRAGTTMCAGCTWDPKQANAVHTHINFTPSSQSSGSQVLHAPSGILLDQTLKLIRFAGSASIATAQFDAQLVVSIYITSSVTPSTWPGGPLAVFKLFPVVQPAALASISARDSQYRITGAPEQAFDVVVNIDERVRSDDGFQRWWKEIWTSSNGNALFHIFYDVGMLEATSADAVFHIAALDVETVSTSSGLGCCGVVEPAPWDSVNPRELKRCRACAEALLPANAHWDGPNDCSWACDKHYEVLRDNGSDLCQECFEPTCDPGEYWTECGSCAPCSPKPDNSKDQGRGLTRYDSNSCPFECLKGFYRTPDDRCLPCTPASTLNCTTKLGGPYFEEVCSVTQDASCLNCRVCPLGSNASTQCSSHSDAVCSPCNVSQLDMPLPAASGGGAEWSLGVTTTDYCQWRCAPGLIHNTLLNTCVECTDACARGYYPVPCTLQHAFAPCLPCNIPAHAVVLSSGTRSLADSCSWTCATGDAYNTTSKECEPVPVPAATTITTQPTTVVCPKPSICEFGFHLDDDVPADTPCAQRCVPCDTPPPTWDETLTFKNPTVYMRRGSCAWVCRTPLMQVGDKCYPVADSL